MGKKIATFITTMALLLSMMIITVFAASPKAVKSVTVRVDNKKVAQKTYTLATGESKRLEVTSSPKKALKSVDYQSSNKKVVSVNKNGRITAKRSGTARIRVTVTGKNNKKKSNWVDVRVRDSAQTPTGTKVLVAYFSATNTTEKIAEYIAKELNADLQEINPADPYTAADLNYNNSNSRCSVEMDDPDSRPAIADSVENMEQYQVVFLGYPIWWGSAPKILSTFLESYDFTGKIIIPFCTSGSSGIGSSATNLENLISGAQWLAGRRFGSSTSRADMVTWVNGLGLDISLPE